MNRFRERMNLKKYTCFVVLFTLVIVALNSCSTEKNTLINRTYHQTTAKYNGHFNAKELLNQSLRSYRSNLKEDYYSLIPIISLPNEQDVQSMYPAIDTAISKTMKVISKHSMPSAEDVSKKNVEWNSWIDENWITTGEANYYRRNYELAIKNFQYVRRFYKNDPSTHIATLWLAKSQIKTGNITDATLNLNLLDEALEESNQSSGSKGIKNLFSKDKNSEAVNKAKTKAGKKRQKEQAKKAKKKKKKEEEKQVEFPEEIRFDFELTKAELALIKKNNEEAIKYLEESLNHAKKKEKGRVHYVIAQLYALSKNNEQAKYHYTKTLKYPIPFEMNFTARINRAFMGGDEKIKKELNKMIHDGKFFEFRDQLYYALSSISLQEGQKEQAIVQLNQSIFYNLNNVNQKGRSYEKLGDISFNDRDYVKAQKYYDSCGRIIPETFPNAEVIRNKAAKLFDLVVAIETAQYEDSVQRIAKLSPEERIDFAEKLIEKMKKEEEERKKREAERLKELQSSQNNGVQMDNISGNKSYWNNAKLKADGFNEFKRQWGVRENEDHWRRKDKVVMAPLAGVNSDEIENVEDQANVEKKDSITPEQLLANIPLSDSAMAISNEKLLNALYDAGVIYKEQLSEIKLATQQFEKVLERNVESKVNMMAAFQLYKIFEKSDAELAGNYKSYLFMNYPNSDYSNYLRDPDYFVKKKEFDELSVKDYTDVIARYNRGLYYPVIIKADHVIENEKTNVFRSKYMLLKALSVGQMNDDKQLLVPVLNQVIDEYPDSDEAKRAKEMLEIIKNGYSKNVVAEFTKDNIYDYDSKDELMIMIFLKKDDNTSLVRSQIGDFNKEFFSQNRLNTSSTMYNNDPVVLIKTLKKEDAVKYISTFKRTKKHIKEISEYKIIAISTKNLKTLLETKKLKEYELFFEENY